MIGTNVKIIFYVSIFIGYCNASNQHDMEFNLRLATKANDTEAVKCLIDAGADVDAVDPAGQTAFYWASSKGHLEVAKVLEANGANMETKNKDGKSPIIISAENRHVKIVEFLNQHGITLGKFRLF